MEDHYRLGLHMLTDGTDVRLPAELDHPSVIQHIQKIKDRHGHWVSHSNVSGFGLGEKIKGGQPHPDQLALRVYVVRKQPKKDLSRVIPRSITFPGIGTLQTDVIEIGRIQLQIDSQSQSPDMAKYRPAPPGSCVGTGLRYGTFSCLVRKNGDDKKLYILSNNHVIANSGLADRGASVSQPSPTDQTDDRIAELEEIAQLSFSDSGFENLADAAIARVVSKRGVTSKIRMIGMAPQGLNQKLNRGMLVKKVGIASGLTHSEVLDVDFKTAATYTKPGAHGDLFRAGFRDQVLCHRFTEPGDSGSLVLDQNNRAVGLHFAGSDKGSIFNKMQNVLAVLKIELV